MGNSQGAYKTENLPECYDVGFSVDSDKCKPCKWRKWCRDSHECNRVIFAGDKEYDIDRIEAESIKGCYDDRRYSSLQVVNLARLLCSMPKDVQDIVLEKLEMPDVSLSHFAERKGVSKQAIHKAFVKATKMFPELHGILHNKPGYNRWRG